MRAPRGRLRLGGGARAIATRIVGGFLALAGCGPSNTHSSTSGSGTSDATGSGSTAASEGTHEDGFDCSTCPEGQKCDDTQSMCVIDCRIDAECPSTQCCIPGFYTCEPCDGTTDGAGPVPCASSDECPARAPYCIDDKELGPLCEATCWEPNPFLSCVDDGSCCAGEVCDIDTRMCESATATSSGTG